MDRQRLIVTADDFGLTQGTSESIIDAHLNGMVTATSVLAVARNVGPQMSMLDDAPDLSVGVHLAVVGEDPPLLSAAEIPTLVEPGGSFRMSWRPLVRDLVLHRVDPADVRREFDAQIEFVSSLREVTHLDTHQHVHLWPAIANEVVALAKHHGIAAVRVPRSSGSGPRSRLINRMARQLAEAVNAGGLTHTARFRGIDEAGHWSIPSLGAALDQLAQGSGSVEINCHPGATSDPERGRFAWAYSWGQEHAALTDPELRLELDRLGFELSGR